MTAHSSDSISIFSQFKIPSPTAGKDALSTRQLRTPLKAMPNVQHYAAALVLLVSNLRLDIRCGHVNTFFVPKFFNPKFLAVFNLVL